MTHCPTLALAPLTEHHLARGDGSANVIPWAHRRRFALGGRGGGNRRQQRGTVILWPHPYRPRQLDRIDYAIAWTRHQHSKGVIDDVEAHVRLEELDAMRGWGR
jgi:hypothetical protein